MRSSLRNLTLLLLLLVAVAACGAPVAHSSGGDPVDSVVRLRVTACGQVTVGTGYVAADGVVVTAAHGLEVADQVEVERWDAQFLPVEEIRVDHSIDTAALTVTSPLLPDPLPPSEPTRGENVESVAHGSGRARYPITAKVLEPHVVIPEIEVPHPLVMIDTPVNPGASGAPLLNSDGQVVAMIIAGVVDAGGEVTVGVPSGLVARFAESGTGVAPRRCAT